MSTGVTGTSALGWGVDDKSQRPVGTKIVLRDPSDILSGGPAVSGDVICWNYASTDASVRSDTAPIQSENGVLGNVEPIPAAPNAAVAKSLRIGVVQPAQATPCAFARQEGQSPMGGGAVGQQMRVAVEGLVTVKVQIPTGDSTVVAGTSLVHVPGERHLAPASGTNRKISGRLVAPIGPNNPVTGAAYTGEEVVWAHVELSGEIPLGFDQA